MHENAINGSQLWAHSYGEFPARSWFEAGDGGVREAVQVQRDDGNVNPQPDVSLAVDSGAGRQQDLREEAYLCIVAPERVLEFRKACDSLCRCVFPLGSSSGPAWRGDPGNTVCGGGLGGYGTGSVLRLQGAAGPVEGSKLPGSNPVKAHSGGTCCYGDDRCCYGD